ncbi:MAG TPA: DUF2520 domain-containing protein [Bacteroidales bacterium]|nr:DUF2520 domain-containing protein [Bacteroidales bacterium]
MTNHDLTEIRSVVLIGAGNLAWHIGHALKNLPLEFRQIVNRSTESGKHLAQSIGVPLVSISEEIAGSDLYIICVSDDAIGEQFENLKPYLKGIVVHTAGSVSLKVLSGNNAHGVLYPLQTFSKDRPVDFSKVPLLIEGSDEQTTNLIRQLAIKLSENVQVVNSEDRALIHLAAVMASNFSNHLLDIAGLILAGKNIPLSLLEPLMLETIKKAFELDPGKAQTGPALRGNTKTINRHIDMLSAWPEIQEIYRVMSESITNKKANR